LLRLIDYNQNIYPVVFLSQAHAGKRRKRSLSKLPSLRATVGGVLPTASAFVVFQRGAELS
jgi:hypothetical protein